MNERKLIREFFDKVSSNVCLACGMNPCQCEEICGECFCDPCKCPGHSHEREDCHVSDYGQEAINIDNLDHGEAHHEMEISHDGTISPEELHHHFDLDDDGHVTPQEYVDHIEYHIAHPESLDHYKQMRHDSHQNVPCQDSYDSCSKHLLGKPEDIEMCLKPLMDMVGGTCKLSSAQGLLDVLKSLSMCGKL